MTFYKFFLPVFLLVLVSCGDDEGLSPEAQLEVDKGLIEDYLSANGITANSTDSGLYYVIDEPGFGATHPDLSDVVEVKYTGYLTDGTVFDQTEGDATVSFGLSQVIEGWQEGIPLFMRGGSGTLFIPSYLAYGSNPPDGSSITENAVLIFDIELIDF